MIWSCWLIFYIGTLAKIFNPMLMILSIWSRPHVCTNFPCLPPPASRFQEIMLHPGLLWDQGGGNRYNRIMTWSFRCPNQTCRWNWFYNKIRCCRTTDFSEHHHKTNKSVSNVVKFKRDCSQIEGRSSQYLKHFLQSSVYAACQKLSHKKWQIIKNGAINVSYCVPAPWCI